MLDVRLAQNEESAEVQAILRYDGYPTDGLDWSEIYPHWLIAVEYGKIIGTLQVCLGKPTGRLEWLATAPWLTKHAKGRVVRALILQGLATLKIGGASAASGMVPFHLKAYKRVLKKRGGVVLFSGNTFMKLL